MALLQIVPGVANDLLFLKIDPEGIHWNPSMAFKYKTDFTRGFSIILILILFLLKIKQIICAFLKWNEIVIKNSKFFNHCMKSVEEGTLVVEGTIYYNAQGKEFFKNAIFRNKSEKFHTNLRVNTICLILSKNIINVMQKPLLICQKSCERESHRSDVIQRTCMGTFSVLPLNRPIGFWENSCLTSQFMAVQNEMNLKTGGDDFIPKSEVLTISKKTNHINKTQESNLCWEKNRLSEKQ